jgi:hypothetical protein
LAPNQTIDRWFSHLVVIDDILELVDRFIDSVEGDVLVAAEVFVRVLQFFPGIVQRIERGMDLGMMDLGRLRRR